MLSGPSFPSHSGSCIPKTQGRCPYNLPHSQPTKQRAPRLRHCLIIHHDQIPTFAGPPVPTFTRSQVSKLQHSQAARFFDSHDSHQRRALPGLIFQVGGSHGRLRAQRGWRPLERPPSPLTPVPCETKVRRGRARYLTLLRQNCLRSGPRPWQQEERLERWRSWVRGKQLSKVMPTPTNAR